MRYQDAAAFRTALEQRLKDGTPDGATLSRARKRIAFDRLLVRLQAVAADRWVLKGGFALDLRLAARARSSTRVKDLVDLALIAELAPLDAMVLRREIDSVFNDREAQVPRSLPLPPSDWSRPFERLAEEVGLSTELVAGHREAAAMLDPVLNGDITDGEWSPAGRVWVGRAQPGP